MQGPLPGAKEARARELALAIAHAAQQELLEVARTLVEPDTADLFGATEFKVRDLILKVAAKAHQQHPTGKKTAVAAPA